MSSTRAKIVVLLTTIIMGAGSWMGAAAAQADPPLQSATILGYDFGTFGDHDYCHGAINVNMTPVRGRPGFVRLTLTSHGFTGQGPGWAKNPVCRVLVIAEHTSAIAWQADDFIPVAFGPQPGQKVVRDIFTGSGLVLLAVNPYALNTPVRSPQGYGSSYYVLVP